MISFRRLFGVIGILLFVLVIVMCIHPVLHARVQTHMLGEALKQAPYSQSSKVLLYVTPTAQGAVFLYYKNYEGDPFEAVDQNGNPLHKFHYQIVSTFNQTQFRSLIQSMKRTMEWSATASSNKVDTNKQFEAIERTPMSPKINFASQSKGADIKVDMNFNAASYTCKITFGRDNLPKAVKTFETVLADAERMSAEVKGASTRNAKNDKLFK